jgi:ubiquinone/menaquinone biosynthesis C-methylase UbiE
MTQTHTFSAQKAHQLDNKFRRLLQNPFKILAPFVSEGMTVLDYGCGNGYFSVPLSIMVGKLGKVYAVDIQCEMLDKLTAKLSDSGIKNVTQILKGSEKMPMNGIVDLAIAVYVVHEIPDPNIFFKEIFDILKPQGKLVVIEPDFIVSRRKFKKTVEIAKRVGFIECEKLNLLFSKSRILLKN